MKKPESRIREFAKTVLPDTHAVSARTQTIARKAFIVLLAGDPPRFVADGLARIARATPQVLVSRIRAVNTEGPMPWIEAMRRQLRREPDSRLTEAVVFLRGVLRMPNPRYATMRYYDLFQDVAALRNIDKMHSPTPLLRQASGF